MSRHTIPALDPQHAIIVGYDPPLETFFAQAYDATMEESEEAGLLWVGLDAGELPTVAALQSALEGWAMLPGEVVERLQRDQGEAKAPTRLQMRMRHVMEAVCSEVREDMHR